MAEPGLAQCRAPIDVDFSKLAVGTGVAVVAIDGCTRGTTERAGRGTRLSFDRGTLLIEGVDPNAAQLLPGVIWDPRVGSYLNHRAR